MTELFLVRARLRRDLPAAALAPLLVPAAAGARMAAAHRLLWSLFTDDAGRRRDFLWRETEPGAFLALAPRRPADPHGLFELDAKPFAPVLRAGQALAFSLRANPVVAAAPDGPERRGKRRDVVTQAIAALPHEPCPDRRRIQRQQAGEHAAALWLARQGERHGFALHPRADALRIEAEDWVRIPREGASAITFLALTIEGVLLVGDPARFLARLAHGFGAARAFGCGLMLIRRAPAAWHE